MQEFTVDESTVPFRTPFFTIRRDRVVFPGGTKGDYYVMERAPFSAIVASDRDGRICLVSAYRHPVGERFWELPQGSEATSEDRLTTAQAELRQEAGQKAGVWRHLGTIHEAYGYSNATCDVFEASDLSSVSSAPEPSEGNLVPAWFTWAEIWRLVDDGQITDAVSIASLAMSDRRRRAECE